MKQLIIILLFSVNLCAQRDTLISSIAIDSDTLVFSKDDTDSILTYTVYDVKFTNVETHKRTIASALCYTMIDSLIAIDTINIDRYEDEVETAYYFYQRANSILWNIRKRKERLVAIRDLLYGAP